jgi:hypothetical protein
VAHHVLESWKSVPGIAAESTADPEALQAWVDRALTAGADKGRSTIGAEHVGKVLSHGPTGADGAWPHEAIRSVIEKLGNEDMERGFEIGKVNSRGVISRSLTEGGRQEMSLADQYAAWARQLDAQWPRTAAMLRRMEASYRSQARSEDAEAALREDDLG